MHRKMKREGNKDDPNGHKYKNDQKKTRQKKNKDKNKDKDKEPSQQPSNLMQSRVCAGISNAGSTCFFASIIQIIANTKVPSILAAQRMTQIPHSFHNTLNVVFQQLLSNHDITKELVQYVFSFFTSYKTNVQADANEFFHFLINSLGIYFTDLFSFATDEVHICQRCGFISIKTVNINQIELYSNTHIISITDLLNEFWSKQYELQCICSRCQNDTIHIKRNRFTNLPQYLENKLHISRSYENMQNQSTI